MKLDGDRFFIEGTLDESTGKAQWFRVQTWGLKKRWPSIGLDLWSCAYNLLPTKAVEEFFIEYEAYVKKNHSLIPKRNGIWWTHVSTENTPVSSIHLQVLKEDLDTWKKKLAGLIRLDNLKDIRI